MSRICVDCQQPLKDQQRKHFKTDAASMALPMWRRKCYGPSKMKDAPAPKKRGKTRLPIHYRYYAQDSITVCGLVPGRSGEGYVRSSDRSWTKTTSDVTWSRVNVRLEETTCEHCLMLVIKNCKTQLRTRLEAIKKSGLTAGREARGMATVSGLKRLVNA